MDYKTTANSLLYILVIDQRFQTLATKSMFFCEQSNGQFKRIIFGERRRQRSVIFSCTLISNVAVRFHLRMDSFSRTRDPVGSRPQQPGKLKRVQQQCRPQYPIRIVYTFFSGTSLFNVIFLIHANIYTKYITVLFYTEY